MNYWTVPGVRPEIIVDPFTYKGRKKLRENISISPTTGMIHFYLGATKMMGFKVNDKINFLILGYGVFLYKSKEGITIRKAEKTNIRTQSKPLGRFLREALNHRNMTTSHSYKCGVKKTNSEFNGSVLFEIVFPMKVKSAIKGNLNNSCRLEIKLYCL